MATLEDTNRSGRKICTLHHFSRVAMDHSPRVSTWQAEEEPIVASQLDHTPGCQRRLGHFSGGVDMPYGKKTD